MPPFKLYYFSGKALFSPVSLRLCALNLRPWRSPCDAQGSSASGLSPIDLAIASIALSGDYRRSSSLAGPYTLINWL